ncbi:SPASM domain-containing protein [Candidatus Woesearchaeota archaeon]|nr:SPASM domain-containing protein [Candidatus Woesearchaeota archaeon]
MDKKYFKRNNNLYMIKYVLASPSLIKNILIKGRIFNLLLNVYEQKKKKKHLRSRPYMLQIEPICGCNLKCPLCPVGNGSIRREKGVMSYETYLKVMQKIQKGLVHISFWNWGEPLLNKDIYRMISYAKKKGIHTLVATNGYLMTPESSEHILKSGLDEIRISLDGASKESYSAYRQNSDFDKVIRNIRSFIEEKKRLKKKIKITIQFIVMKHNQHEIGLMKEVFKGLGADYLAIKTVSAINDQKDTKKFLPDDENLSRFKVNENTFRSKSFDMCYLAWKSIVINWNGEVTVCCRDVDAQYSMGNILANTLSEIWNGKRYVEFRKKMLQDRFNLDLCRTCSASQERYLEEEYF